MSNDKKPAEKQKKQSSDGKEETQSSDGTEEAAMAENSNDLTKALKLMNRFALASNPAIVKPTSTGGVATSNLRQVVKHTLDGLVGRDTEGDPKATLSALENVFEPEQVSGREVYTHVPRAYPAIGATDLGAGVSGAQFSLVSFAKTLHEQTKPLIRDLRSLDANVDETELQAAKAVFSATWDEFVAELSREGGPRASRANSLADRIFKPGVGEGYLSDLAAELSVITGLNPVKDGYIFARGKVTTKEEEGYLTTFIALTDYYFAVVKAWKNYETPHQSDLGNGLLAIERALSVISGTVNEVYTVLDLVGIDQHERLVIVPGFQGANADPETFKDLTIEDFLSWVSSFASREAPALITRGGKRGIKAISPTAKDLSALSKEFSRLITQPNSTLPKQLNDTLVINALSELERYLAALEKQAKELTA